MTDDGFEDSSFGDADDDKKSVSSRKIQVNGRINIPDDYLEHIGVGEKDRVFVIKDGDEITIKKASPENIL